MLTCLLTSESIRWRVIYSGPVERETSVESLFDIAPRVLGLGARWPAIYNCNMACLKNGLSSR